MFTSKLHLGAAVAILLSMLSAASSVHAREEYHADLLAAAGTTCTAQLCVACHNSPAGSGPVGQVFLQKFFAAGYSLGVQASAKTALAKLRKDGTDSDGDGTADAEEIRIATNPNSDDPAALCNNADFGCLNIARRGGTGETLSTMFIFTVILIDRWRRGAPASA